MSKDKPSIKSKKYFGGERLRRPPPGKYHSPRNKPDYPEDEDIKEGLNELETEEESKKSNTDTSGE